MIGTFKMLKPVAPSEGDPRGTVFTPINLLHSDSVGHRIARQYIMHKTLSSFLPGVFHEYFPFHSFWVSFVSY